MPLPFNFTTRKQFDSYIGCLDKIDYDSKITLRVRGNDLICNVALIVDKPIYSNEWNLFYNRMIIVENSNLDYSYINFTNDIRLSLSKRFNFKNEKYQVIRNYHLVMKIDNTHRAKEPAWPHKPATLYGKRFFDSF